MTTVLADAKLGVMVSDSFTSNGERVWRERKVWRARGHLLGFAGPTHLFKPIVDWFRSPEPGIDGMPEVGEASVLILGPKGLQLLDGNSKLPQFIQCGREAIGTGSQAAIAVYEALRWSDPKRAVEIVCKHDAGSRGPVRLYRLITTKGP